MTVNEKYMFRCLQLAKKGEGFTKPNPMVGAVIVHKDKIIGEGFHCQFGKPHAEVNAIASVEDPSLLSDSTLYVSLEPCAHFGKTPPCTQLIISKRIPRVVIASTDPNPAVAGKGIEILQNAGIEVSCGVLEKEAKELNKMFFVNQLFKRPYIILKWAQSNDGFIDIERKDSSDIPPAKISNIITQCFVHKERTEVQGIMVGTNTVIKDNPLLTARKWSGNQPVRITLDRNGRIPTDSMIFNDDAPTIVFTEKKEYNFKKDTVSVVTFDFRNDLNLKILNYLYSHKIYSVMIEGGTYLLNSFIEKDLWDEAYVEVSDMKFKSGVKSPSLKWYNGISKRYSNSLLYHIKNEITRNFL